MVGFSDKLDCVIVGVVEDESVGKLVRISVGIIDCEFDGRNEV